MLFSFKILPLRSIFEPKYPHRRFKCRELEEYERIGATHWANLPRASDSKFFRA
jgi:hypothetical protein